MKLTVRALEAIPLRYQLRDGGYGSSRGIVAARETTLVCLKTSDGVVGWGEAWGPPLSTVPLVNELAETLVGSVLDGPVPFVTNRFQQHYHRGGGLFAAALSGVEIALWDALGRTLDVSVATLLGGRAREYVTPYASAGYVTPDRDVEKFREALTEAADGFAGAKIKCGLGVAEDVERTAVAREVLGPDRALMVDINGNYTADQAIASACALRDLHITWLEEPLPPDDVDGLLLLRRTSVPLATGEALYTRAPFRRLVTERLVDFVQPDVTKVGGLAEARAICELARAWNIRVSPHVWGGGVGLSAALQLLASIPDYPHTLNTPQPLWLELDRGDNALRELVLSAPLKPEDGCLAVPTGPGLGIEVDAEAVEGLRADR
jgi:D-galactarolactone cycloisomerase